MIDARVAGLVISAGAHVGLLLLLEQGPSGPPEAAPLEPVAIEIRQRKEPMPPEPEPPAKEPVTKTTPVATPERAVHRPEPQVSEVPEPKEPVQQAEPVELSGVTLSNAGAGWSAAAGSGGPRTQPIRSPRAGRPGRAPRRVEPVRPTGPKVVPVQALARPPVPPALDGVLARNYPPSARRQGISGQASVRARIDPDGRVRSCQVTSESHAGFGEACRRTVLGTRWSPPRDKDGRPVATWVRYTCRFHSQG